MSTRLVLLTNDFPFLQGDVNFIRHEIDALAGAFDEVVVFNYARTAAQGLVELPPSVRYGGNLYGRDRRQTLSALFSPSSVAGLIRVVATELRGRALRGHVKEFLLAALVGMRLARHPALRSELQRNGTKTAVYSFWGMGAALSLPWLPRTAAMRAMRLHRYDLYEEESGYLPFRRSLFKAVDRVLPVSQDAQSYLFDRYPDARLGEKSVVSRLGTHSEGPPTRRPRSNVRTIVSCSAVSTVKRVERILDALELVRWEEPIRWLHFGGGPLEQNLRERKASVAMSGVEVVLCGATDNAKIFGFYEENRVDLFLNVSSSEGVPVSIMEAMSFGIPIIATCVGGTPEIVGPTLGSGELVSADFADRELATIIERVLDAPDAAYSPRVVWEELCDSNRNSAVLARILADGLGKEPTP